MIEALYIAISPRSPAIVLDAISNNVANLNTAGFKATVEFTALMTPQLQPGANAGQLSPGGGGASSLILNGVAVGGHSIVYSQGVLKISSNRLDIAILGDGFLEVEVGDGKVALSRGGRLSVDSDGYVAINGGHRLASSRHSAGRAGYCH